MVSKEEFRDYVFELVKDDENIKINKISKKKNKKSGSSILTILFGIMIVLSFFSIVLLPIVVILTLAFSVPTAIIKAREYETGRKIENKYKDKLVDFLLKDYEYVYDKDGGIAPSEFKKSPMYQRYDRYETEDFLKIGLSTSENESSCYMQLSDLRTIKEEIEKNDDGTYEKEDVILFNGTFGFVEFKESFKTCLHINCSGGFFNKKLKYVKLEDMSFNKKFYVYSDDQIEARYILNPRTMDLIDKLNNRISGKHSKRGNLSIALIDNKMYFAFKGGFKLFTLNYYCKNVNEIFDDFYDDIDIILSLINEIRKNYRIFKI